MNLDYVLSNVVDPGAVVTKDFLVTRFLLGDGRVVAGIVAAENEATVTVQTAQDRQTIPRGDIESRVASRASLMPDGLLSKLADGDVRDLVAYLMSADQVPLPAETP